MNYLIFLTLWVFTASTWANEVTLEDAPIEFLIVNTLKKSLDDHGHIKSNKQLVHNIFETFKYDQISDELIISHNKHSSFLKNSMLEILRDENKQKKTDPIFEKWEKEDPSRNTISIYRTDKVPAGHYFLNHIHTNISQDNASLKYLKISPHKTYNYIKRFLKKRRIKGTTSFTDHDTDAAFDLLSNIKQSRLKTLRGVEWGGATHMNLVDINKEWFDLPNGRKYSGEQSVIRSRTSGGFRIINHPNRKGVFPYQNWNDANGVEVWNTLLENSPFLRLNLERSNNRKALAQWSESLKVNKNYTALAGSDFHFIIPCLRDRSLVYPVNFIPNKDNAQTRQELDKGNVSFLTRPDAPKLTLLAKYQSNRKWAHMGETIKGNGKVQINLFADFSDTRKRLGGACYNIINNFYKLLTFWKKRFWEVRFYNKAGEIIAKRIVNPKRFNSKRHFKAVFEVSMKKKDLIRAELWQVNRKSKRIDLLGATNPVYLGN